jgi:hypothetical protein
MKPIADQAGMNLRGLQLGKTAFYNLLELSVEKKQATLSL